MAGKRRRSHKSSKVLDSESANKRFIGNTTLHNSSCSENSGISTCYLHSQNHPILRASELSEDSSTTTSKVTETQDSVSYTSPISEIHRAKYNFVQNRHTTSKLRLSQATSQTCTLQESSASEQTKNSANSTTQLSCQSSTQIGRRTTKRSLHYSEDIQSFSQDKLRAAKRQRLSSSKARQIGAYHSSSSHSKSSDRKRHSFASPGTAHISQNLPHTATGLFMSKRSRRDRQQSVTSMTATSSSTIKNTNTGDNVFSTSTSNYSMHSSLSTAHCTGEKTLHSQIPYVQLPTDSCSSHCSQGVMISNDAIVSEHVRNMGFPSTDLHHSVNPESNVPFYVVQKSACAPNETQDPNPRLLNQHYYILPDLSRTTERNKTSSSEFKSSCIYSNTIQLRSSKNVPVTKPESNRNFSHIPIDLTANTLHSQIPMPLDSSSQPIQLRLPVWSSVDQLESQTSFTTSSSSVTMASSLQNSSNYRKRTLESFTPAQSFYPPTSDSSTTYRTQTDPKYSTDLNIIPMLPNSCSPFLVSPGTSAAANHPNAIQQLLNPISVARLIALNQNMHSNTHYQKSSQSEHLQSALSSSCLTSSFHPTVSSSSGKYSRYSPRTAHSGSASTSKSVVYTRNHSNTSEWSNLKTSATHSGYRSSHSDGINHRIAQLQQASTDRSMQLIILQDINQILLMDFEENLANLDVNSLVNCVLQILESQEEHLVELKNLSCNVLTHMMDVLPRSSDFIVPALPILLTTMSSSFVGDILERIINLLEQISRRHGKEVLKSGGVSTVLGFYDFVTSAQHRTILTMVYNCFINLQPADYDLISNCLPTLAEHLKESEPRCVERVCSCFVRLISAYRFEPNLLKSIVNSCNLLTNLQSLLTLTPSVLSSIHEVIQILATLCSSCPDLAVDLIKQNISNTIYSLLLGVNPEIETDWATLTSCFNGLTLASLVPNQSTMKRLRSRSHSGESFKPSSSSTLSGSTHSSNKQFDVGTVCSPPDLLQQCNNLPFGWQSLMITNSAFLNSPLSNSASLSINQRSPDDVHSIVYLVSELLPPISNQFKFSALYSNALQKSNDSTVSNVHFGSGINLNSMFSTSDSGLCTPEQLTTGTVFFADTNNVQVQSSKLKSSGSSSSVSSNSSSTLLQGSFDSINLSQSSNSQTNLTDPRSLLLYDECKELQNRLLTLISNKEESKTTHSAHTRRRSIQQKHGEDISGKQTASEKHISGIHRSHGSIESRLDLTTTEALQMVQILLPLLFEIFTETTKTQTRLLCLEAIQRMIFYSSPLLLAKVIHPRLVCSHIAGMLNSPEKRVILMALQISVMLLGRIPFVFSTHFRKEGIIHRVEQLILRLTNSSTSGITLQNDLFSSKPVPKVSCVGSNTITCVSSDNCASNQHINHQPFQPNDDIKSKRESAVTHGHHEETHMGSCSTQNCSVVLDMPLSYNSSVQKSLNPSTNQQIKHRIELPNTVSHSPTLLLTERDPLLQSICSICEHLQARTQILLKSFDSLNNTSTIECTNPSNYHHEENKASPSSHHDVTIHNLIDLMPILKCVAHQLNSDSPNLWIRGLNQLIDLFKPNEKTLERMIEPPSPFELQESGVTNALLNFLTSSNNREIRLWIMFRMFLGRRATTPIRFSPTLNLENINGRKWNGYKNWFNFLSIIPDLFLSDHSKLSQLSVIEFEAFRALIECLLAYLHRHEHFQVNTIPSLLPPSDKWISMFGRDFFKNVSNPDVVDGFGVHHDNTLSSPSPSSSAQKLSSSRQNNTPKAVGVNNSGRSSNKVPTQRVCSMRTSAKASHPLPINYSNNRVDPSNSGWHSGNTDSKFVTHNALCSSSRSVQITAPTPGILHIELHRMYETDGTINGSNSPLNHPTSPPITGTNSKSGRKSSLSSTSSEHSANTSFSLTTETCSSLPHFLPLRITALATIQNVERLLLQRNYVNSVLQENGFSQQADYNLTGFQETFIDHIADDLCTSPQSQLVDEVTDNDDEDMDSHTHSLLRDLQSVEGPFKNHSDIQHSDTYLRTAVAVNTSNIKAVTPERRQRNLSSRVSKPSVLLPSESSGMTSIHIQPSVSRSPRHLKSDVYAKYLSLLSLVSSENPIHERSTLNQSIVTNPNVHLTPPVCCTQTPISSKTSVSASSSLQRGLRSLLQRSSEILPLMTRSGIEKPNVSNLHSVENPNAFAAKKTDCRSVRRRSTTNVSISDILSSTSTSLSVPGRVITPFSHFLRSVTNPLGSDDNSSVDTSVISSRRKSRKTTVQKESDVIVVTTNSETSVYVSRPVSSVPTQLTSRYRRLKGGSLFTTLGVLASNSATTTTTASVRKGPIRRGRSGGIYSSHLPQTRSFKSAVSPSLSSTSNASSPVGSEDSFIYHGKLRPTITFYIGGHCLPSDIPLYEAVRKFNPEILSYSSSVNSVLNNFGSHNQTLDISEQLSLTQTEKENLIGHFIWSLTHVIQYRVTYQSSSHDTSGTYSSKHNNISSLSSLPGHSLSPSSASLSPKDVSDSGVASIAPSFPTTLSLSAAITCFKHRRPSETDTDHVDSLEKCPAPSSTHTVIDSLSSVQKHIPSYGQTFQLAQTPLFDFLVSDLPEGFLTDIRCDCGSLNQQPKCLLNAETVNLNSSKNPLSTTLSLLRVLYNINRLWYTVHNALDPFPIYSSQSFQSQKLAVKAKRQLQDVFSVLAGNLPSWLIQLISVCPFLFPFDIRRTFFYAYNFDRNRALLRFQDLASSYTSDIDQNREQIDTRSPMPLLSHGIHDNQPTFIAGLQGGGGGMTSSSSNSTSLLAQLNAFSQSSFNTQLFDHSFGLSSTSSQEHNRQDNGRNNLGTRGRYHLRLALSPNFRRHKVTVNRDEKRLLKQAEMTLNEMGDSRAVLEIAFEGEVGFGLGPTLEFYTLISRLLMKSNLSLWHGCESTSDGYLIAPAPGLYPRPFSRQTKSSVIREVCGKFNFLGRLLARALLDWRRLDLPFSPAFFKWFLAPTASDSIRKGHILPSDLSLIDPDLGRHIRQLTELVNRRQALCHQLSNLDASNLPSSVSLGGVYLNNAINIKSVHHHHHQTQKLDSIKASLAMLDNEVDDLCLNFTLPGYEVELIKNGAHTNVTGANLSCYLRLVAHWLVIEGASRQMEAVLKGFDSVLPNVRSRLTTLFQPDEMENLFCGESSPRFNSLSINQTGEIKSMQLSDKNYSLTDEEGWDVQSLTQSCCCDHGYTPQSRAIRLLFEIMSEFTPEQRRLFVQFVTGSPRLPVGGFRALKPPLKIVMKRETGENVDHHLPSVMTCQNYLKLPDYSSKELMLSKLLYAINEGQNAFHLS
uniref:E3 ubiquitin-protein ligase n=2 Tax=Schistosoma mansoni TaxID=6183 RepID=A0A3Q0KSY1_SCHMA